MTSNNSFGKAVFFSFAGRYLSMILQLGSTVVLARLIAPQDYGLFSIAFIFMATASIIKEFGVNNYLVKEKTLTQGIIRSAFGILLLLSTITATTLFLSAYFIADFYNNAELVPILQLLSLNVLLSPFGTIVGSLLKRDMNFKPDVITGLSGQTIGLVCMIIMALNDFGVYTLVYGSLIQTVSQILIIQLFRPANMPRWPSLKHCREIFSYSKFAGVYGLTGHFGTYAIELLSGKYFTLELTGQVSRAMATATLFNKFFIEALNPVIMPYVSKVNRTGGEVAKYIEFLTKLNLSLAWPFFIILGLCAQPIILLLFGEQWLISAYFLQILCIGRIIYSSIQLLEPVMMGLGMAKQLMQISLITNIFRVVICLVSLPYGLMAMVTNSALLTSILVLGLYSVLIRSTEIISLRDYLSWLKEPAILLIACSIPMLTLNLIYGSIWWQHYYLSIPALGLTGIIWIVLILKQKNAEPIVALIKQKLQRSR
jgi:teichuronic acid exporter